MTPPALAEPPPSDPGIAAGLVQNQRAFLGFLSRRLSSRADAEDVLQEFCLRALLRQDQLREADHLVAWLYALLRSTLADHYRRAHQRGKVSQAWADEMKIAQPPGETDPLHDDICACLHALLAAMRPDQAALVRRIDLDEEPRAVVSAELGLGAGAFAVRLHRARQALQRALLASCASCLERGFDDCGCAPERAKTCGGRVKSRPDAAPIGGPGPSAS